MDDSAQEPGAGHPIDPASSTLRPDGAPIAQDNRLLRAVQLVERGVVGSLVVMMMLVIALSTIELAWTLARDIVSPPLLVLEVDELLDVFGLFLLVLIGVELLETTKMYVKQGVVHLEVILEVALIAIARKVIVLDVSKYSSATLFGIAALVAALSIGLHVRMRRGRDDHGRGRGDRAPAQRSAPSTS